MEWNGIGWMVSWMDEMEWNGIEWNGMEWMDGMDRMELNGEWNGIEWMEWNE